MYMYMYVIGYEKKRLLANIIMFFFVYSIKSQVVSVKYH